MTKGGFNIVEPPSCVFIGGGPPSLSERRLFELLLFRAARHGADG